MVPSEDPLGDGATSNLWIELDQNGCASAIAAEGENKSSQMASPNKTPSIVHSVGDDEHRESSATKDYSVKSTHNQDRLLQVPEGGNVHTVEPSTWDWDAPLESVGDSSSSYYFEPQGVLLQEQREQQTTQTEFTIPHAVGGTGMSWPLQQSSNGSNSSDGFAIPRKPTGNAPTTAGVKRKPDSELSPSTSRPADKRMSRTMPDSGDESMAAPESAAPSRNTRSQSGPSTVSRAGPETVDATLRTSSHFNRPPLNMSGGVGTGSRRTVTDPSAPMALPARKVFPIQIGDKLFRLSGASISSDAPSYFSQFFEEQLRQNEGADNVRTLYIDRDPATFEDIALHLQGYHVEPRDGPHFVKLFADAQFFSLPRLTAQLFSTTIYIRIGDQEFQIPRDLFSNPGDSPNYFSLGFSVFFTTPSDVFPGLSERTLLRPPSMAPPSIPNKSAKTFADLLHVLKGYPLEIRSEEHRQELLRDARYFHLKGLEQRLIPHTISYNLARKQSEILIRLEDIRQSGISFVSDNGTSASSGIQSPAGSTTSNTPAGPGWIHYQRPYVDSEAFSLIVEIGGEESTFLSLQPASASNARLGRATFHRQTLARITSLFSVIASKMNLPITQPLGLMMLERGAGVASMPVSPSNTGMSEEKVKVRVGLDADVMVDGKPWTVSGEADDDGDSGAGSKRRKQTDDDEGEEWVVRKAQWRLRIQPSGEPQGGRSGMEVILGAVKIEAFSNERSRNAGRGFLA